MAALKAVARGIGGACVVIGALQLVAGSRAEPGMDPGDPTVDSHVRYMGSAFIGYGLGWLDAARGPAADVARLRTLAWLMGAGGASRLITRATIGRPHRFHDVLLVTELAAPVAIELLSRGQREH